MRARLGLTFDLLVGPRLRPGNRPAVQGRGHEPGEGVQHVVDSHHRIRRHRKRRHEALLEQPAADPSAHLLDGKLLAAEELLQEGVVGFRGRVDEGVARLLRLGLDFRRDRGLLGGSVLLE